MAETQRTDGNIGAGARGFVTSVVTNPTVLLVIQIACAMAAAIAWAFAPSFLPRPLLLIPVLIVGLAALIVPIWLSHHKAWLGEQIEKEKLSAQAEPIALLRSFLTPCIEMLPLVAQTGHEGQEALARVKRTIVTTVQQICGPSGPGVRAVLFEVEGRSLLPKDWTGGDCNSTRRFTRGNSDVAGKTAWATASTGLPQLWANLALESPAGFVREGASTYQTFITCGVLGHDGQVRAMLNVDGPRANDLTLMDAMIVGFCAKFLGAAYALSEPGTSLGAHDREVSRG